MPIKRRPSEDDRPRRSRDEEDEKPAARRRARDEDEESDLPRKTLDRHKRARDDDDDEPDERPRRRASRDDEDEHDRPRRKNERGAPHTDADDDDEDDEPKRGRGDSVVKSGWGAAKRAREESGDFLQEFKFEGEKLVKFLQDEPFAVYKQHWIDSGLKSTKKKSFICMGKGCPLCKIGDKPDSKFAFNVAEIDAKDEPAVRALIAGPRLLGDLETNNDGTYGPLSKHYWTLARSGKGSKTSYPMNVVKARDLAEDFDIDEEVVEDDLKNVKLYGPQDIQPMRKSELQAIADELMGEGDDDEDDDEDDRPRRRR